MSCGYDDKQRSREHWKQNTTTALYNTRDERITRTNAVVRLYAHYGRRPNVRGHTEGACGGPGGGGTAAVSCSYHAARAGTYRLSYRLPGQSRAATSRPLGGHSQLNHIFTRAPPPTTLAPDRRVPHHPRYMHTSARCPSRKSKSYCVRSPPLPVATQPPESSFLNLAAPRRNSNRNYFDMRKKKRKTLTTTRITY